MTLPSYNQFYKYILSYLSDGREHSKKDIISNVAIRANLTDEDMAEMLPSGPKYRSRIGWGITYLKMACLVESPEKGVYRIIDRGREALKSGADINNGYLEQFSEFREFVNKDNAPREDSVPASVSRESVSPDEKMDEALKEMNSVLVSDIISEISKHDPYFFESLVVDVIQAIYGGEFQGNSEVTPKSNDGGIDGVVKQDRLGFNSIYIQAKKYAGSVDRPEIQKFSGAMDGAHAVNGAFITSSTFTDGAKRFVQTLNNKHIVLIDGKELASLMIEYKVGVQVRKTVDIKKIDYDYFHPE